MAKLSTSAGGLVVFTSCLALIMLFSYEIAVCEGSRGLRAKDMIIGLLPPAITGRMERHVADNRNYGRRMMEEGERGVVIRSPVAYYGEELNDTTPGHSPGAGHSTGPGAATPVITN
uniref:Uncharacterized protein n=1 Tax=Kalanchoe fedtschenkoi TaxID=63787 RepID=A0A7N0VMN7_KALFE